MKIWYRRLKYWVVASVIIIFIVLSIPYNLSNCRAEYSTVLYSNKAELLSAQIAEDGQWRFPIIEQVPNKIKTAILTFEDKRFFNHWGVDLIAICRALQLNMSRGRIVSGGSTITMQLARISEHNKPRTYIQKIKEMIIAARIDWQYSKNEILSYYLSLAPFGGNVVGAETAAWRYYSKSIDQLSWAESTTLAVLPNAPGLIHPNRNREDLKRKRNALLRKLFVNDVFDKETYEISIEEPLPDRVFALPNLTPHLLEHLKELLGNSRNSLITTIDLALQKSLIGISKSKHQHFSQKGIDNIAICVVKNETGEVIGYLGNNPSTSHESAVDMIQSPRSSGSILKPFLYALMIDEGLMTPSSVVKDIPVFIDGFSPSNYNKTYSGLVPANQALSKSLNIPFVLMLKGYGVQKFHFNLRKMGSNQLTFPPSHYGLSLIIGGAEVSMIDLVQMYSTMALRLNSKESKNSDRELRYTKENLNDNTGKIANELSRAAIYSTFEAMSTLVRPNEQGNWQNFSSSQKVAWKTGTSFGHRDAWAIGVNTTYTVGVWVGNADGEGREEIVGVSTAGDVLFNVLQILPDDKNWFEPPYEEMELLPICALSGMLPTRFCDKQDTILLPQVSENSPVCKYHKQIRLDPYSGYRLGPQCRERNNAITKNYFVMPAHVSTYYRDSHPFYKSEPEMDPTCRELDGNAEVMEMVYPNLNEKILLPRDFGSEKQKVVFEIAHKVDDSKVFWYINDNYVGETISEHKVAIALQPNRYNLLGVDSDGNRVAVGFEIVGRD